MSIFPIDRVLAGKARRLAKKGLKGKAISEKLGKGISTNDANLLAAAGAAFEAEEAAALTERELSVLVALASLQRERRSAGDLSSPKAKQIGWRLRLSDGQVRRATTRLNERSTDDPYDAIRFGFLHHSTNGHIWMKPQGWAFVQALPKPA